MLSHKRILISPLNWGLGHATRCIPIIRLLIKKNAEVIIAADGRPLELLKQEFPTVECTPLKSVVITYPEDGSMIWKMFFSIPKILFGIYREHQILKKMIAEKKIDIVISDNRFGLWNKKIKSIFITHQLMIKAPFAEKLLHKINLFFINKYDECWIPDVEGPSNLSGDLAHQYPLPSTAFFVGSLSRFNKTENITFPHTVYDIMAIISGPEPQRSIFESLVVEQLQQSKLKALVVCGKTETEQPTYANRVPSIALAVEQASVGKTETKGNIKMVSHLKSDEMQEAIMRSGIIISRSGYSTIMDLARLGKKAVFVPTPGQTEQEYLAERLMQQKIAYSQQQSELDLQKALKEMENYTGFEGIENNNLLEKRITPFST